MNLCSSLLSESSVSLGLILCSAAHLLSYALPHREVFEVLIPPCKSLSHMPYPTLCSDRTNFGVGIQDPTISLSWTSSARPVPGALRDEESGPGLSNTGHGRSPSLPAPFLAYLLHLFLK